MIITYLKLFCTFAKIGMFTIGGGYAMIPLIEREIVKRKWIYLPQKLRATIESRQTFP